MNAGAADSVRTVSLDAFCVDLEEWFHVSGYGNPYDDVSLWDSAEPHVEKDTGVLLDMLAEFGYHGTFLTVGWIAEKYPQLIKRIADAGHEVRAGSPSMQGAPLPPAAGHLASASERPPASSHATWVR